MKRVKRKMQDDQSRWWRPHHIRPQVMMDFIELMPSAGKKYCLVVDMWSRLVEVFPRATQSANNMAKALLTEIIPRWGIPDTHFANEALTQIGKLFGIDIRKHCAYHPASGGAVKEFIFNLVLSRN